jgi:hypothetical protein
VAGNDTSEEEKGLGMTGQMPGMEMSTTLDLRRGMKFLGGIEGERVIWIMLTIRDGM